MEHCETSPKVVHIIKLISCCARVCFLCIKTSLHLNRAHVCCVSDVFGAQGMERNIGDQLNKAFEAYRQVSIEKENAIKQLQQMVKKKQKKKGHVEEM